MKHRLKTVILNIEEDHRYEGYVFEQRNGLFLVEFDNSYDLSMTFLRYQEFYESSSPKFKGKAFTILDYMEWYSKQRDGVFTYPTDWAGFNIPSSVYYGVKKFGRTKIDHNKYDECMDSIVKKIESVLKTEIHKDGTFYLIGVCKRNKDVLNHELAHGLYHINKEYKKEMDGLYKSMLLEDLDIMHSLFKEMGYAKSVYRDETQAYLSTGNGYLSQKIMDPFKEVFKRYSKGIKI